MAKDPAFLFYPGDFTTGTQFLTDEQVGKYIRLLMAQHQLGHLEEKHMIMICKTYDKDVFNKFDRDSEGLYYNKRLEDEIVKRKKYTESRSNNRSSKNNISKTYDEHMEDKNKNIDKDIKVIGLSVFFQISDRLEKMLPLEYILLNHLTFIESSLMNVGNGKVSLVEFKKEFDKKYPSGSVFKDVFHLTNCIKMTIKKVLEWKTDINNPAILKR